MGAQLGGVSRLADHIGGRHLGVFVDQFAALDQYEGDLDTKTAAQRAADCGEATRPRRVRGVLADQHDPQRLR